jgi:hypothetical protein
VKPLAGSIAVKSHTLKEIFRVHWLHILLLVTAALWPFANFYNANLEQIDYSAFSDLRAGLLVTVTIILVAYIVLAAISRYPQSVFVAISVLTVLFFLTHPMVNLLLGTANEFRQQVLIGYAAIAVVLIGASLGRGIGRAYPLVAPFIVLAAFLPVAGVAAKAYRNAETKAVSLPTVDSGGEREPFRIKPNVYFFISDTHPDLNQSKAVLGYDATPFFDGLKKLNFVVPETSYSNYPITFLSLGSTLSMQYVVTEQDRYSSRAPFYKLLRGHNIVFDRFRSEGYKVIRFEPGAWLGSDCQADESDCVKAGTPFLNVVQQNFWQETMLPDLLVFGRVGSAGQDIQAEVYPHGVTTARDVKRYLQNTRPFSPYFVMVHSLPPHGPWIYQENCSVAQTRLTDLPLSRLKERLARETRCTDQRLLELADYIAKTDPTAIVIFQSDHGTPIHNPFASDNWNEAQIMERFSILNAWRVPDQCRNFVYEGMSSVNTFRIVFACLEGRTPKLLEDVSYIAYYEGHRLAGTVSRARR